MALKLSTGMVDAIASKRATLRGSSYGANLALVDNGAAGDTITDSDNGLLTDGFFPGDKVVVVGATTLANDTAFLGGITIVSVVAGTITVATAIVHTAEDFIGKTYLLGMCGGSIADLMRCGVLRIFSGSQPADADTTENGDVLVEITLSSGAFTPGTITSGLLMEDSGDGVIGIRSGDTWSGAASATGTAGWFRFYDNTRTTGASTSAVRFDGTAGTSGTQLILSSTSITALATVTLDSIAFTMPQS